MQTQPKVSVIVPVYGTAWSLRQCLDSLVGQSLRDIEIIIVNDASPDEAGEIIDGYVRQDPRVRSMTNAVNCNLFESRLRGIEIASGNFFAFCDSDDVMPPQALKCLYAAAVREGADIVHGRTRALRGEHPRAVLYNYEPFHAVTGRSFIASMMKNIRGWNVWGKLFCRTLVRSCLGSFPRDTMWFQGEDMAFCTVFGLAADRYVKIKDIVYAYRYSDLRSVRDNALKEKRIRDQLQILAFVCEAIKNDSRNNDLTEYCLAMTSHIAAAVLRTIPAASWKQFSGDLARLGLEFTSIRRKNPLSWRYHYDYIRQNGMREYEIRLKILLTEVTRLAWRRKRE